MRAAWILLLVTAVALPGCGSKKAASVVTVGEAISLGKATPLKALMESPEEFVDKPLLVEGRVTGRCRGSGCWVSLDTGDADNPFYAKSSDHSFVFPPECMGQKVRIQGVLQVMYREGEAQQTTQQETASAHGEACADAHAEEGEQAHTCPAPIYFLDPIGAEICP